MQHRSHHPIVWLYTRGYLDADQLQAFDAFQSLVEAAQLQHKSAHLGREIVSIGLRRMSVPEAAFNAKDKYKRALNLLSPLEQYFLVGVTMGYSLKELRQRHGKIRQTPTSIIQSALSTLHHQWASLDRRRSHV